MRDGQGNKLPPEEADKVKAVETDPERGSLRRVSVDPGPGLTPMTEVRKKAVPPEMPTAPKF